VSDPLGRPAKIVFFVESWMAVTWYRCNTPALALNDLGYNVTLTDTFDAGWIDDCDVLVVERPWRPEVLHLVMAVNARGGMTVFDTDDDYWTLHPENPAYEFWDAERLAGMKQIVHACKLVTTTTPELVEVLRPMNKNVRMLPNMLPDAYWPQERKPINESDSLVIGWAGSPGHQPDVRMIGPALVQILDEFPAVELHLAGANAGWIPPHSRVVEVAPVELDAYAGLLAGFDIGIAPLIDNRFNRAKSDLKFLEYSTIGIPSVLSRVSPYTRSVKHGENGYLAVNTKDWLKYLRALVRDPVLREDMASRAWTYARTRMMSNNVDKWLRAYGLTD
jgi:glycosyltransferase involved in cell wall biosynthesis